MELVVLGVIYNISIGVHIGSSFMSYLWAIYGRKRRRRSRRNHLTGCGLKKVLSCNFVVYQAEYNKIKRATGYGIINYIKNYDCLWCGNMCCL